MCLLTCRGLLSVLPEGLLLARSVSHTPVYTWSYPGEEHCLLAMPKELQAIRWLLLGDYDWHRTQVHLLGVCEVLFLDLGSVRFTQHKFIGSCT